MEYLIIIFVIFIALSPLISMRPSPKKLKQARLRQTAATLGMVVTFSDMPARYKSDKPQKGICYRLLRQGKRIKQAPSPATYQRSNEGWLRDSRLVTEDSKSSIDIELLNSLPWCCCRCEYWC